MKRLSFVPFALVVLQGWGEFWLLLVFGLLAVKAIWFSVEGTFSPDSGDIALNIEISMMKEESDRGK